MHYDTIAPTPATQRLELLDGLRGFALAGVLFANLTAFSLYYFLPDAARLALPSFAVDRWLSPFHSIFVSAKFITLFSLLFGIGFALQMQRAGGTREGMQRYVRRLAVLLLIGLLHAGLLWWGDILRYYAIIGLILVPMQRLSPRMLVIIGVLLAMIPHALVPALWTGPTIPVDSRADAYANVVTAFTARDWPTMLRGNLAFDHWWIVVHWQQACWVAGCLLIGSSLGRQGVLSAPQDHGLFWKRMLRWVLPAGLLACIGLELESYGRLPAISDWLDAIPGHVLHTLAGDCATLALSLGFMAAFVSLFPVPGVHRWARHLAPVGRMALSNYLAHSLIGVALFYGIGFGIGPRYGMAGVTLVFMLLFSVQIATSRWWLSRFRFGPAEWLWRSLTYGRWQPMRIAGLQGSPATGAGA